MQCNKHHRKPSSLGGDDSERNLVTVSIVKHQAWHCLVGNATPQAIARILTETWLDPDWSLVAVKRKRRKK